MCNIFQNQSCVCLRGSENWFCFLVVISFKQDWYISVFNSHFTLLVYSRMWHEHRKFMGPVQCQSRDHWCYYIVLHNAHLKLGQSRWLQCTGAGCFCVHVTFYTTSPVQNVKWTRKWMLDWRGMLVLYISVFISYSTLHVQWKMWNEYGNAC